MHLGRLVFVVVLSGSALGVHAGPLTPPSGPVGPSMKTLDVVEPARPVQSLTGNSSGVYVITQPGSYYLAGNMTGQAGKNGIVIAAGDVTLDLRGFAVVGANGSLAGISVGPGHKNVTIREGIVRGFAGGGIGAGSAPGVRIENVTAQGNGAYGIWAGDGAVISGCAAHENTHSGITVGAGAVATGCVARSNSSSGISAGPGCTVTRCTAMQNGNNGITVGYGSNVAECASSDNADAGFYGDNGVSFAACSAFRNGGIGIVAGQRDTEDGSSVRDCAAHKNGSHGIFAGFRTTVRGSTATSNGGHGISASTGSFVTGCTAGQNALDGINASSCSVMNNVCDGNGFEGDGAGIRAATVGTHIEGNTVSSNDVGIAVTPSSGCVVIRNIFRMNTTNVSAPAGNTVAPLISGAGVEGASANPFANVAF